MDLSTGFSFHITIYECEKTDLEREKKISNAFVEE